MASITLGIAGIRNKVWDIRYTNKTPEGFLVVSAEDDVTHNLEVLNIDMDSDDQWGPHHFKGMDGFFVFTSQAFGKRFQYIVMDSACEGDIIEFAKKKPKRIAKQIYERLGLE